MPVTYELISSNVLGTAAATVTFSSIPATYTDLVVRGSVRSNRAAVIDIGRVRLNGLDTGIYSYTVLQSDGTATSYRDSGANRVEQYNFNGDTSTSNTFTSYEIYIPNYLSTTQKPLSLFTAQETNSATTGDITVSAEAALANLTSAVTSITLGLNFGSYVSGSSFYLYGIKNS
jgi:hypothetical protein